MKSLESDRTFEALFETLDAEETKSSSTFSKDPNSVATDILSSVSGEDTKDDSSDEKEVSDVEGSLHGFMNPGLYKEFDLS